MGTSELYRRAIHVLRIKNHETTENYFRAVGSHAFDWLANVRPSI